MSQTCLPEIGLFLRNSAGGANGLAGSAINAGIRIDIVLGITLRNRADRAFTFAGATGNAFAGNGMCHLDILLIFDHQVGFAPKVLLKAALTACRQLRASCLFIQTLPHAVSQD